MLDIVSNILTTEGLSLPNVDIWNKKIQVKSFVDEVNHYQYQVNYTSQKLILLYLHTFFMIFQLHSGWAHLTMDGRPKIVSQRGLSNIHRTGKILLTSDKDNTVKLLANLGMWSANARYKLTYVILILSN